MPGDEHTVGKMPSSISEYIPQFAVGADIRRRRALLVWSLVAGIAVVLLGAVLLAPVFRAAGWVVLSQIIYASFHSLCHQAAERSFHIDGFPLAVCARCTGLYVGAASVALFYPLARRLTRTDAPAREWLMLAALPTSLDLALGIAGVWENTHVSRFVTALILGAAVPFYVVPAFVDVSTRNFQRFFRTLYAKDERREEVSRPG